MKTGFDANKDNFNIQFENGWSILIDFYNEDSNCNNKIIYSKYKNAKILIIDPEGNYLTPSKEKEYVTSEKLVSILQSIRSKPFLKTKKESENDLETDYYNESETDSENESETDSENESESEENEEKSWCGIQ